ncbi:hypothetical protein GCM10008094_20280 [Aidingimonas halophila]|nr:hypothetical protein GCM10008094_20280 [Aidingimonas halophila]
MILVDSMDQFRNVGQLVTAVLETAFPDHEDTPSQLLQILACLPVAANICLELGFPE